MGSKGSKTKSSTKQPKSPNPTSPEISDPDPPITENLTMKISKIPTKPFEGQKPGTSGLRKKTTVFMQPNYVENFVQATFNAVGSDKLKGATLVVGGDGRYYNKVMIQTIISMAAANGVAEIVVGQDGLLSTPAVSGLIRRHNGGTPIGAFILTASHNPGGKENDCGIKYNIENGGPAPENLTDKIYENTKIITEFYKCEEIPAIDLGELGKQKVSDDFPVDVIDSTSAYVELMHEVFDLKMIKSFLSKSSFNFVFDGMHGVSGPYAKAVFNGELGVPLENLDNCDPLEDFGKGHPDPNLTYAHDLVAKMGLTSNGTRIELSEDDFEKVPDMGAACDGDADRNMILGKGFFVTPSDSVAILAANAEKCIPFFKDHGGLGAIARSMPTSGAADLVAQKHGVKLFEVPTGWKFFGNLMDSDTLGKESYNPLICGEESFGTGSNHVREKDGIWAVLAWLSVLAFKEMTIEEVVKEHWQEYGRNYYSRYDYENVDSEKAQNMTTYLTELIAKINNGKESRELSNGWILSAVDEFEYHDPVDGSVSSNQGWRFVFEDGSRFVFRLSGTGSVGATIRLYLEKYEKEQLNLDTATALQELIDIALNTSKLVEFTGRASPTVIT